MNRFNSKATKMDVDQTNSTIYKMLYMALFVLKEQQMLKPYSKKLSN